MDESVRSGLFPDGPVVYVLQYESPRAVRVLSQAGRRAPLSCTGSGRARARWMANAERAAPVHRMADERVSQVGIRVAAHAPERSAVVRPIGQGRPKA